MDEVRLELELLLLLLLVVVVVVVTLVVLELLELLELLLTVLTVLVVLVVVGSGVVIGLSFVVEWYVVDGVGLGVLKLPNSQSASVTISVSAPAM